MSDNNGKKKSGKQAGSEQKQEKVITRYDRKVQKRKEQKEREKRRQKLQTAAGVVIVAALVCLVASFPIRNYLAVHGTYIEIGGEKISRVEYDYSFHSVLSSFVNENSYLLSYLGVDFSRDLSDQMYSGTRTWKDYFDEMTVNDLKQEKALQREMEAQGFTYDTSEEYAEYVERIRADAADAGVSVREYVKQLYGDYATVDRISDYVRQSMALNAFYEKVSQEKAPSEEEIEAYYQENKDAYDEVDYRMLTFYAELPTEPTELADPVTEPSAEESATEAAQGEDAEEEAYVPSQAEIDKAMADAKALADAAETTVGTEGTLNEGVTQAQTVAAVSAWLFDASRKKGDTTVIEDTVNQCYYAMEFENRYLDQTPSADLRVLITESEDGQALLDGWKSGEATEESFAQLCREHSEDTSTAENGGLYEGLADNGMDEALSSWIYDSARKPGDTTVIVPEDGTTYVFYYIGANDAEYQLRIRDILLSQTLQEYVAGLTETMEVSDPKHHLNYLYVEEPQETASAGETSTEGAPAGETLSGEETAGETSAEEESAGEESTGEASVGETAPEETPAGGVAGQ